MKRKTVRIVTLILVLAAAAAAQAVSEVEPNNSSAQADLTGITISATTLINGSISPVSDIDFYRLSIPTDRVVTFETLTVGANDCDATTTVIRIYNNLGTQFANDGNSGIRNCSFISVQLVAGNYYVSVEESGNNAAIASYGLRIGFPADAGSETEPNETLVTANPVGAPLPLSVFGDHSLNADSDFYSFTLTSPRSIRAEIIEGNRQVETCESLGVDSRLTLYNSVGAQLVDDDDDGRGFCSQIDGRGATPTDAGASNLPAGTYYLQVRASDFSQGNANGQFTYRLVLQLNDAAPTAAGTAVSGRAVDAAGRAAARTTVTLDDMAGNPRTVRTGPRGEFRFENVISGRAYLLTASGKRLRFMPQVVTVNDNLEDLVLTALP